MDQALPYDETAERALVGAVLLDSGILQRLAKLDPECFYLLKYRKLWRAFLGLDEAGEKIDPVTVAAALKGSGELDRIGGVSVLVGLTDDLVTLANVEHYAEIVARKAATRRMIHAARDVIAMGLSAPADVDQYLSDARSAIIQAAAQGTAATRGPVKLGAGIVEIVEEIGTGKISGTCLPTGFADLDRICGGVWAPLLHVVAGRPGMGKSALALNLAINVALSGKSVLYHTLEDAGEFQRRRALARLADLDLTEVILGRVDPAGQARAVPAANLITTLPLWINDCPATIAAISQDAATLQANNGLDLLIIDHLGYLSDTGESEYAVNSAACRAAANLGKDLNVPVILLVQLNRAVEQRTNKRPIMSDLRSSGRIEEDARAIWFLYRDFYYNHTPGTEHDLELILAKNSHGPTGRISLWCDLAKMYIRDTTIDDPPSTQGGDY